jgi:hypothetical protein
VVIEGPGKRSVGFLGLALAFDLSAVFLEQHFLRAVVYRRMSAPR